VIALDLRGLALATHRQTCSGIGLSCKASESALMHHPHIPAKHMHVCLDGGHFLQQGRPACSPRVVHDKRLVGAPSECISRVQMCYNEDPLCYLVFIVSDAHALGKLPLYTIHPLNPFKNKPPLAGWYSVAAAERPHWERLARAALNRLAAELQTS
jgi:hypothetical protein